MTTPAKDIGDGERFKVEFRDADGTLKDPDTATFRIVEPDGAEDTKTWPTNPEVIKDTSQLGTFYRDWIFAKQGRHRFRWEGAGAVQAAEGGTIYIKRPRTE